MKTMAKSLFTILLVFAAALCSGMAAAQTCPSKPVRLIIPFPPGGSNGIVGRLIASKLTERLGKQVIADNRGGAGGVIGTEADYAEALKQALMSKVLTLIEARIDPGQYAAQFDTIREL